ncbi:CYTH domain-containing protein [Actinoplanes sp. NPDC049118]|uniref:CYTH domain-containing protein n=1 Tax=Actinoplanes sp. NPDC049118 TaxID=3155769 RepID=UPI0033DDB374
MSIEFEAKVLDVDPAQMTASILSRGGRQRGETLLQRRHVYDITPGDESRWIRLRDTGAGVTLAVKEIAHDGIDGTDEVEVGVDRFETTNELLGRLGFTARSYQENRRTSFELDGARLEIDEWPLIPPYLEIEAGSRDEVVRVAALLDIPEEALTGENTVKVYARYGIDLFARPQLRFGDR